jgi:hypothetical protein
MPNQRGNAYALTTLCPLLARMHSGESPVGQLRDRLDDLQTDRDSPFAAVPETYFVRLFVLDSVNYQGVPATLDVLRNAYLVFIADFHGPLEPYLHGLWTHAEKTVRALWADCVGFAGVKDAASFVRYIQKCQVTTTFYFDGSNDAPLAEQLKALYLKQEFASFVAQHQGLPPAALQQAFQRFVARTQPGVLSAPTWRPGASELAHAVVEAP